jgi:hypothetical protein
MSRTARKVVECIRDGKVIARYELAYGQTQGPSGQPDLIKEAQEMLKTDGTIKPPFNLTGITYRIRNA